MSTPPLPSASAVPVCAYLPANLSLDLDGPTPVPSAPISEASTRVNSREPSLDLKRANVDLITVLQKTKEHDFEKGQTADAENWTIEQGKALEIAAALQANEYPEGGLRAWLTVAGAVLVLLSTFGLSNSFGVFLAEYRVNQLADYPASTISWIGSTHLFLTFASAISSGILFDKGYFRYQLLIGSILWIGGMFSLSASKTFTQIFLSHAVCLGLGLGLFFNPCLACCATYFQRRRALVVGCTTAGAGVGATIIPIMLNRLFASIGYAAAVRAVAYMMAGLLIIANLIMRPRNLPKRASKPILPVLKKLRREAQTWLVCLGTFGIFVGLFIPLFYVVVYARSHGASPVLADYALSIINASAIPARICAGLLADRFGVFNLAIPFAGLVGVMTIAMLGATSTAGCAIFLVLFGIGSGGFIALSASTFLALANDVSELGLRSGVGFMFVAFATLIGSPIAGALLTASGQQYWAPLTFGGVMALLGTGCLVAARRLQAKRKASQRV